MTTSKSQGTPQKGKEKRFQIIIEQYGVGQIVYDGTFNPSSADTFTFKINPNKMKKSLVTRNVKRALDKLNDIWLEQIDLMPPKLQKKVEEYFPIEMLRFTRHLRDIQREVMKGWKL